MNPLHQQSEKIFLNTNKNSKFPIGKYKKSVLGNDKITRLIYKLNRVMREEKLYLDNTLNLTKLACHINSKTHDVSQVLNQILKKSFFDYINMYRIETALKLLANPKKKITIYDIAMESGFNSKSVFYSAFKKHTGITPNEYKCHQTTKPGIHTNTNQGIAKTSTVCNKNALTMP